MKKMVFRSAGWVSVLGAVGLSACDAAPPPSASVSPSVEIESISAGETLTDVVRDALYDVVQDDDPFSRARRLGTLLPTLGPETVSTVKPILEDLALKFRLGSTEVELLVRYWATHQPEEATRWAVEQSPTAYRIAAVNASLTLWAKADPGTALIAADEWMERTDVRDVLLSAAVRGWYAANDPPELMQFIKGLGIGFNRQRALSTYIRALATNRGVDAVMRWAESLPDDNQRYKLAVYRQVASGVTLFDLDAGLRWCEAHCEGPYGSGLRRLVSSNWARRDGEAAISWLLSVPEYAERDFTLQSAFKLWLPKDRDAALVWMAAQTTGKRDPWTQPMFALCAQSLAADSPAEAIVWADRIEDDSREFTLIQVARAWRKVDEAASEAWLLESSLSEEAREEVRAPQPVGIHPPTDDEKQPSD